MKSFKLEKAHGSDDVTREALMWLAVLVLIVAPVLFGVWWVIGY